MGADGKEMSEVRIEGGRVLRGTRESRVGSSRKLSGVTRVITATDNELG